MRGKPRGRNQCFWIINCHWDPRIVLFCPYYSEIAVTRVAAKIARSAVPQDAAELVAMAQKALFLTAPIALGLICTLIVILFALGDTNF